MPWLLLLWLILVIGSLCYVLINHMMMYYHCVPELANVNIHLEHASEDFSENPLGKWQSFGTCRWTSESPSEDATDSPSEEAANIRNDFRGVGFQGFRGYGVYLSTNHSEILREMPNLIICIVPHACAIGLTLLLFFELGPLTASFKQHPWNPPSVPRHANPPHKFRISFANSPQPPLLLNPLFITYQTVYVCIYIYIYTYIHIYGMLFLLLLCCSIHDMVLHWLYYIKHIISLSPGMQILSPTANRLRGQSPAPPYYLVI